MTDAVWQLDNVSLDGIEQARLDELCAGIGPGITVVLGPSGSGKSSLLGLLCGFERPDHGRIEFRASAGSGNPQRLPLFWSPQDHGLWPHLTVAEHLEHVRPTDSVTGRSVTDWLERFGLKTLSDALPGRLSQGERSRLSVVRTLASEAHVVVLDEPLVHVEPRFRSLCHRELIQHVRTHCHAAVVATHDPLNALANADCVIGMSQGRIVIHGTPARLLYQPDTLEVATLAGPCNWFESNGSQTSVRDFMSGMRDEADFPVCIRPWELQLVPDNVGPLVVSSQQAWDGFLESTVSRPGSPVELVLTTAIHARTVVAGQRVRCEFTPASDRP